jgi:hypothetical protein
MLQVLKSKTILFSLALALFGVLAANLQIFAPYMTQQAFGFFTAGVSVIVAVLRVLTTLPLNEK